MTTAQRFFSLSVLGVLTLTTAPLTSAMGPGGHGRFNEEIRSELKACKEEHDGDREAMKACADTVFEEHGIERPERSDRPMRGHRLGHKLRSSIEESCGDRENTASSSARDTFRERRSNLREQLQTCLELDDIDELKTCVRGVRDQIRENTQE